MPQSLLTSNTQAPTEYGSCAEILYFRLRIFYAQLWLLMENRVEGVEQGSQPPKKRGELRRPLHLLNFAPASHGTSFPLLEVAICFKLNAAAPV